MKRFNITSDWIASKEDFKYYIFSDESTLQLEGNVDYITTTDKRDPRRLIGTAKFPRKIHVWGAISLYGPGPLVFLKRNETLKKENYSDILEEFLIPFIDTTMGRRRAIFQQDNARCHVSKYTMDKLTSWNVTVAPWAPASPDLSPIEYIWREMKVWIRREIKPTTTNELEEAIKEFWSTQLTQKMIKKYFVHTQNNIHLVHSALGGAIVDKWR
ncbi:hypothetical protein PMAYCL1PPCAC_26212 [Pristionchus mayeri]|uniref:Tc1-like transposase DDE domain-containing protein n=1 Tax=Pristionchus mayeri TaxID=1317129 RepID=A0AAN4ZD17_9BILA|nr:hypothetical protein PMAYCL1PPCAC_09128 [Pristionchus mayeri]GMR39023.1 hypothetical protein PMAYCL1PPCAC_09218 [Pristionchus mayeri]GMR39039.1 hypothetical protein PMAYCL1PPCAC_09234 [Pristionchus mayeri]GMR44322.1 hypothetical protein PMAYCL1PPCAC_14517 [Pristionchus mayeri]GMR56005.1 hypothetical protein PMAYCL1PPCAC_26200 [Pristionchus mayeri]